MTSTSRPFAGALMMFVVASAACLAPANVEILDRVPSFRARALAIANARGAGASSADLARMITTKLRARGLNVTALEDSDEALGGASMGLEDAANPGALAEIRRASNADAVVFLTVAPNWASIELSVIDADTGALVCRARARPRSGDSFASPDAAADGAVDALRAVASRPAKVKSADAPSNEIPVP